jgi:phenylacetate-CoA ligase
MACYQDRRLRQTVQRAARVMPFYRQLLREAGVAPTEIRGLGDIGRLPIVTRDALRDAGEEAWAEDLPAHRRVVSSTSGSSGNPLRLLYDRGDLVRKHAVTCGNARLTGWRPWHRSMALGVTLYPPQDTILQKLGLFRWAPVRTTRPVSEWIDVYEQLRPQTLKVYPSALREMCYEAKLRGGLKWKCDTLLVGGETYPFEMDELVEETFDQLPKLLYGAMEAGRIALGCGHSRAMHVRQDAVVLEILDDDRPASPGESGRVLITSLIFVNMPIIRYDLGDIAEWEPGECACGLWWPRLHVRQGRGIDILPLPGGRRVPITTLGGAITKTPCLRQYQFVQTGPASLLLRYEVQPGTDGKIDTAMTRLCRMVPGVECSAERVDRLPRTATGKVTRFVRG